MKPSVGRIVHYIAFGTPGGEYKAGAHRAAIVTQVHDTPFVNATVVDLCIFNPTGLHFREGVVQDESRDTAGSWHWPEKVDE